MFKTFSKQIVKHSKTLNCSMEITLFPAAVILKLVLRLLEPLYKTCLNLKPQTKFSLVQYFWSLASKAFLSTVVDMCLSLYYSIMLNLCGNQTLVVGHCVPFYLATTAFMLIISSLPYRFLVVSKMKHSKSKTKHRTTPTTQKRSTHTSKTKHSVFKAPTSTSFDWR